VARALFEMCLLVGVQGQQGLKQTRGGSNQSWKDATPTVTKGTGVADRLSWLPWFPLLLAVTPPDPRGNDCPCHRGKPSQQFWPSFKASKSSDLMAPFFLAETTFAILRSISIRAAGNRRARRCEAATLEALRSGTLR
jgi:hypothetical protein